MYFLTEYVIQTKQHLEALAGHCTDQLTTVSLQHMHVDFSGHDAVDVLSELNGNMHELSFTLFVYD